MVNIFVFCLFCCFPAVPISVFLPGVGSFPILVKQDTNLYFLADTDLSKHCCGSQVVYRFKRLTVSLSHIVSQLVGVGGGGMA